MGNIIGNAKTTKYDFRATWIKGTRRSYRYFKTEKGFIQFLKRWINNPPLGTIMISPQIRIGKVWFRLGPLLWSISQVKRDIQRFSKLNLEWEGVK